MSPSAEGFVADSKALEAVKESIAQEVPYGLLGQEVKRSDSVEYGIELQKSIREEMHAIY